MVDIIFICILMGGAYCVIKGVSENAVATRRYDQARQAQTEYQRQRLAYLERMSKPYESAGRNALGHLSIAEKIMRDELARASTETKGANQ